MEKSDTHSWHRAARGLHIAASVPILEEDAASSTRAFGKLHGRVGGGACADKDAFATQSLFIAPGFVKTFRDDQAVNYEVLKLKSLQPQLSQACQACCWIRLPGHG